MALVTKSFSDIITFTRNSGATYFDSNGVLQTAGNNVPRLDYNPSTLAAQGLLIEEQRTNSIRNNTMQGAVAGTPGTLPTNWGVTSLGLTQTVVGTGTENGIAYVDIRLSGTTTGQFGNIRFEPNNIVAASSGQTWATSAYLKLVAGSLANLSEVGMVLYSFTSAPAFISSSNTGALVGATLTRFSHVGTLPATTAFVQPAFYFNTTAASGQAIDITLRIGLPQLEQGAFATSVIPTTTTALTRNRDEASVNTLSPWFNASAGTLFNEVMLYALPPSGTFPTYSDINDGTTNNRVALSSNGFANNRVTARNTGGVLIDTNAGGSIAVNVASKWALAYANADYAGSANGGAVVTSPTAGLPSGLNLMLIGRAAGANQANGWIRRITYYPRRLSNAELQTITA